MSNENGKFGTRAVHAGVEPDPSTGAIMTPIFQTSTYVQSGIGDNKGFEYSRTNNPTRQALEKSIAGLEQAKYGTVFGSGIAAVDAVLKLLNPGDEVISVNDLYGGTYRAFTKIFAKFGIVFKFVDLRDVSNLTDAIGEQTKLIWLETPTNPTLQIVDIKAICDAVKGKGIKVCVDNTFASPYLQSPLALGADIIMHSVTKYISGHSDVIMGALVTNDQKTFEDLKFIQNSSGAIPGPMDCFLVLRGIKTLHLRMEQHCKAGKEISEFLVNHPKVDKVYYPGLSTHHNHDVAVEQMRGFGGMVSFSLTNNSIEAAGKMVKRTKVFSLAESLGGVESLIGHPATMTHASIPKEEREKVGITDSLIRLSIGIEDINDLKDDLNQAIG